MSNAVQLDITWDPVKAQSNVTKHGVTFVQAVTVLHDALALTLFDAAHLPTHRAHPCQGTDYFRSRSHQARTATV